MATAYVLINCELGAEEFVISELNSIDGVVEVHGTFGAYDILAKVQSDQVEALRETITWKIRKIPKIRSTLTLMGIDGQHWSFIRFYTNFVIKNIPLTTHPPKG